MQPPSYPAFRVYPVTAPATGPIRAITDQATGLKVALSGTDFRARIEVSNAAPGDTVPPHLWAPPSQSWDTVASVVPGDPPADLMGPIRYIRVVLEAGTLTGGDIAESRTHGNMYGTPPQLRQELLGIVQEGSGHLLVTPEQAAKIERAEQALPLLDGKLSEVDKALADTAQAGAEALALTGIDPAYISETTADPPPAPAGTKGAKRMPAGGIIRLESDGAAWQTRGEGVPGQKDVASRLLPVTRAQLLSNDLRAPAYQRYMQDEYTLLAVLADKDAPPVDNGIVYQLLGGQRAVRLWDGGVRPEWFGAVGNGIHDDSDALEAAGNSALNRGRVTLSAGLSYRITRQIAITARIVRIIGEGTLLWQFRTWPSGADFRHVSSRIFVDFIPQDKTQAALVLDVIGSSIENTEFEFNPDLHPPTTPKVFDAKWAPAETGWAIQGNAWQTYNGVIIRGFRDGIKLPNGSGCRIHKIHFGVYNTALSIELASDVPRIGDIHQSIFQVPAGWDSWTEVTWMLNHLKVLVFGRIDNPVIGDVFCIAARAGLTITGSLSKATFERLEMDECIYGVVVEDGFCDAKFGALVYQRFPEGDSAYGTYHTSDANEGLAFYSHSKITSARNQILVDYLHVTNCPDVAVNVAGETTFVARTIYSANQRKPFLNGSGNARLYNERVIGPAAGQPVFAMAENAKWFGRLTWGIPLSLPLVPAQGASQVVVSAPGLPASNQLTACSFEMNGDSLLRLGVIATAETMGAGQCRVTLRNVTNQDVTLPSAAFTLAVST